MIHLTEDINIEGTKFGYLLRNYNEFLFIEIFEFIIHNVVHTQYSLDNINAYMHKKTVEAFAERFITSMEILNHKKP